MALRTITDTWTPTGGQAHTPGLLLVSLDRLGDVFEPGELLGTRGCSVHTIKAAAALTGLLLAAGAPASIGASRSAAGSGPGAGGLVRVSGETPFAADCNGPPLVAAYVNAEVEPYVAVNPRNQQNLVSVYQEDRFPNDGANGVLTSVSFDGGRTWTVPPLQQQPPFSRCAGGNQANGGDFEKATDPWVDFGPTGRAYQAAVSYNDSDWDTAEFVSTSRNGGRSWGTPTAVIRENIANVIDDRPAVTADPTRPHSAYVVWERHVTSPASVAAGAAWFSRTSDDGRRGPRPARSTAARWECRPPRTRSSFCPTGTC
jgi:hypothetical protein